MCNTHNLQYILNQFELADTWKCKQSHEGLMSLSQEQIKKYDYSWLRENKIVDLFEFQRINECFKD